MLKRLTKDRLVELAAANNVKVDKRWSRDRIAKDLELAGVEALTADPGKISTKVDNEPVRFLATTGRIYVRDIPPPKVTDYGSIERYGLIVDFGSGHGEEATLAGGFSREFYPDLDEHDEETNYCSCAHCLADVRDWIARDKFNIVKRDNIREDTSFNAPSVPLGNATAWEAVHPDDLASLVAKAGLDIENAIRWEKRNSNRQNIVDKLDELAQSPAEPEPADIATAELEVSV